MAELTFTAFLSCSFDNEDHHVADYFQRLIAAFDIEPVLYDYQDVGRLSDQVKEQIAAADCLIAIATRRHKIEGSEHWACPDWIQHEVALAHAYGKPIAVFAEEGVQLEGLIGAEERHQAFDRDNLVDTVHKVVRFLNNLRSFLAARQASGLQSVPKLLRHYVHSHEALEVDEAGTWEVHRAEILMESLVDNLEATTHEVELEETTSGLSVKPEEFDFKCLEKPSDTNVDCQIVLSTHQRFFWKVSFQPPLQKGQRVKYSFKEKRPNYRPYNLADLDQRLADGTYEYSDPKCEACEWSIIYPTYELRHQFEFPEGYDIKDVHPHVTVGPARSKAPNELQRITDGGMFVAEKIFDKWVVKLNVTKPLLEHTYYTYYTPSK